MRRLADRLPLLDGDKVARVVEEIANRLQTLVDQPVLLRRAVTWAAANWILDASCLWVFIAAFGKFVSPIDLMVAYGLANVLAVIPITPSGLGVIEGILIPTLVGFGVPKTQAIVAVLGYRVVNFWLPIPVGGISYLSLRLGRRFHRPGGPVPAPDDDRGPPGGGGAGAGATTDPPPASPGPSDTIGAL